ncbi:hypothetical protein F4677DRAFT_205599 [Hypoxylon crocopeplum]|nr:hypothetical protein F4677DRAFT_205599 [Hypoxylon crocopeplum]
MSSGIPNTTNPRPTNASGWLTIPAPLARLFKKFPLLTYPPNELPARSPNVRDVATLYVFISDQDALKGLPSFNPSCLKWQAFLKLAGVDFRLVSSNNHASPTGALPFLIPPSSNPATLAPVPSYELEQYAIEKGMYKIPDISSPKLEVYESLLDHQLRNGWLYSLYLSPSNTALLSHLYIAPVSSSRVVRATILHQLRHAAETEILKSMGTPAVNAVVIYDEAGLAINALSTALNSDRWFFGAPVPTLFDAAVFSYTHLLLDDRLPWKDQKLPNMMKRCQNLVDHRNRILQKCWGIKAS